LKIAKANQDFIRLRQNTPQLAAGMNGGANAPKLEQRRRVGFGEFPFDTPQLAAGRFIVLMDFFSKSTVYLSDQHLSLPNTASTIAASISRLGVHLYSSV